MRYREITEGDKHKIFAVRWAMKGARIGGGTFEVAAFDKLQALRSAKANLKDRYERHDPEGPWSKQYEITAIIDTGKEKHVETPTAVTAQPPKDAPPSIKKRIRDLGLNYDV